MNQRQRQMNSDHSEQKDARFHLAADLDIRVT